MVLKAKGTHLDSTATKPSDTKQTDSFFFTLFSLYTITSQHAHNEQSQRYFTLYLFPLFCLQHSISWGTNCFPFSTCTQHSSLTANRLAAENLGVFDLQLAVNSTVKDILKHFRNRLGLTNAKQFIVEGITLTANTKLAKLRKGLIKHNKGRRFVYIAVPPTNNNR